MLLMKMIMEFIINDDDYDFCCCRQRLWCHSLMTMTVRDVVNHDDNKVCFDDNCFNDDDSDCGPPNTTVIYQLTSCCCWRPNWSLAGNQFWNSKSTLDFGAKNTASFTADHLASWSHYYKNSSDVGLFPCSHSHGLSTIGLIKDNDAKNITDIDSINQ